MFLCFAFSSSSSCIDTSLKIFQNGKENTRRIYLIWPSRQALIGALDRIPPTTIEPKMAGPHSLLSETDFIWFPKHIFSCELCIRDDSHCKVRRENIAKNLEHNVENYRREGVWALRPLPQIYCLDDINVNVMENSTNIYPFFLLVASSLLICLFNSFSHL